MDMHIAHTEEYEEELKSALICEESAENRNTITAALESMGYRTESATNADETLEKLKFNQYSVIILNESFGGAPESNTVYKHLQFMPMGIRRHLFLALVGQDLKTQDHMTAFAKSANLVINERDLPNIKAILKKAIAENDQFYRVFKESLVKLGKQ
ncbi:MAG: hypothetical protein AB1553_04365 [Nitrospirota bacterium]